MLFTIIFYFCSWLSLYPDIIGFLISLICILPQLVVYWEVCFLTLRTLLRQRDFKYGKKILFKIIYSFSNLKYIVVQITSFNIQL